MSSKGQTKVEEFGSGTGPQGFIKNRTTLIQRGGNARPHQGYMRQSMGGYGGLSMAPGTYSSMSHEGVVNMKGKREHEKKEMQDLNQRFGSYIEKMRFLEAKIIELTEELELYRGQKAADFKPIRDMYENELNQARRVIDELSAEKGGVDAKMAGLQDVVASLKKEVDTLQNHNADLRQKIDNQANQIGSYEGELGTLRCRIENIEDENAKLRQLNQQKTDEIRSLRTDLDNETAAHIEADCRATTLEEQVEFLNALLEKFPQEQKPVTIKGQNLEDYWKNSMGKAVQELQNEFDNRLEAMKQDYDNRYQSTIQKLQSGAVRDNLQTAHAKEESKKLKSQLNGTGSRLGELEARVASLEQERNDLRRRLQMAEDDLEKEKLDHQSDCQKLQTEMEGVLAELQVILDAKLSLELEICCYRQLLEGEESRLGMRNLVEQAVGARNKGANDLSNIVQQTSLSESTGKLTVSKSARGIVTIAEATHDGKYVSVENTSKGNNAKPQNIGGWKITRKMNSERDAVVYVFPEGENLLPGKCLKVYAKGASGGVGVVIDNNANGKGDRSCNAFSWGTGTGETTLTDASGVNKAQLKAVFKQ